MFSRRLFVLTIVAAMGVACGQVPGCAPAPEPSGEAFGDASGQATPSEPSAGTGTIGISFLGDSLTAGLGLLSEQAYPQIIDEMFEAEGYPEVEVLNGGSSGDTTAGGLRRVDQLFGPETRILVVALGGNDALRGLTADQTHDNLAAIIDQALERRVAVLLAGMYAPTNLGEDYQRAFQDAFTRLSTEYRGSIAFVPFLLEGVAGDPSLNQADGIHPNAKGARVIAEHLFLDLRRLVDDALNAPR
jgi:acyl-CoA thioesterase-1